MVLTPVHSFTKAAVTDRSALLSRAKYVPGASPETSREFAVREVSMVRPLGSNTVTVHEPGLGGVIERRSAHGFGESTRRSGEPTAARPVVVQSSSSIRSQISSSKVIDTL